MKYRVRTNELKKGYAKLYAINYCKAQCLLTYTRDIAYNEGTYGWNYDVYEINDYTAITTGYNPVGEIISCEIVKKYEQKAETVLIDNLTIESKQWLLKQYMLEMIQEHETQKNNR